MSLGSMRKEYNELIRKAYTEGVTYDDYRTLRRLKKEVGDLDFDDNKVRALYYDIKHLSDDIYKTGLSKVFLPKNVEYIEKNADLLPLVINHNDDGEEFLFYGDNGFILPFKFTPNDPDDNSIIVRDLLNKFHTTETNVRGTSVKYLELVQKLNTGEALELLCHIYGFKIPFGHEKLIQMADEYKLWVVSDQYKYMIETAEDRLLSRKIKKYNGESVRDLYDRKFATIERVKSGQYDPFFEYQAPPKIIKLTSKK